MTEKHRNVPQGINYELQYTEKIMPMLVFNGYYHHFNGSRNTIEGQVYYWRCVKRAELGVDKCSGTASVKENPDKQWQAYACRTQHNHEPNAIQASIRTFQHELRSEALNERSDPNSPEIQCMNVVRRVLKLDMLDDDFLHQICIRHGYNQEKRAYEASFKYFSSTEAKPSRTCVYNDALETACLKLIKYFGEPGHPDLRLSSSTKTTLEPCRTTYLCFKEDTMHACCRPLLSVFKYNEYEDKDTITKVQERCSLYANATDCKLHCSWWSMICKDVTEFVKAARCVKNITTLTTCPTESPVEDNCDVVSNWANCVEKTVIETCGDLGRDIAMHAALKRDFEDGHMGFYSTL
ncbi:FLYWCH zinc finger domain-containing protein [Ditylenchus destructor]|uniref:FLYWCH zinc finger domain-containing protein n=1 Tax=Ditylenchus destructor TaxID=166010 RepID=A0AAD4N574_9BILA|nr:FLYWCH zinc finger domain-containing protein [Ditylenchus destructor]